MYQEECSKEEARLQKTQRRKNMEPTKIGLPFEAQRM
jgi:hypothetical protein